MSPLALVSLNVLIVVDDEEDASRKALGMERSARLGQAAALEQNEDYVNSELTFDDIERYGKLLGASVLLFPEMAE